ncbi:MAG: hypothetical protein V3T85_03965, partial [Acidiferrobacterales bacterium]
MSNDTDYVRVSREYIKEKRAFEYSTDRMVRPVANKVRMLEDPVPRRPVGSSPDYRISESPLDARSTINTPNVSLWFEMTAMQLHLSVF